MQYKEVKKRAEDIRFEFEKNRNSEDDDFALDVISLANHYGFTVYSASLQDESGIVLISDAGLAQFNNAKKVILVNSNDSSLRRRFTIAHELAHYFLHLTESEKKYVAYRDYENHGEKDKEEREADYFASNLLMPENKVRAAIRALVAISNTSDEDKISFISHMFLVSAQAARVRLIHLGYLGN